MKKLTTDEFIKRAKLIHGDKYKYKFNNVNFTTNEQITITCLLHGEFSKIIKEHLRKPSMYRKNNGGCPKCNHFHKYMKNFLIKAFNVHGNKYNYSKVIYENTELPVIIICPIHNDFEQTPHEHLSGYGCFQCGINQIKKKLTLTTEEFIQKSRIIHGNRYNYDLVNYQGNKIKIKIQCNNHGIFTQKPNNHLNGQNCPLCVNISMGEKIILKICNNHNIKFEQQKKFVNCKNILPLPFDFYLPDFNMCIEYDGRQHFIPIDKWGGQDNLERIKQNDQIKTQYCIDNNIKLLRISYQEFKNIENIFLDTLATTKMLPK